jgi:hypothetical protein
MTSALLGVTKTQCVSAYQVVDHTKHTRLPTGFSPPPSRYGCDRGGWPQAMAKKRPLPDESPRDGSREGWVARGISPQIWERPLNTVCAHSNKSVPVGRRIVTCVTAAAPKRAALESSSHIEIRRHRIHAPESGDDERGRDQPLAGAQLRADEIVHAKLLRGTLIE